MAFRGTSLRCPAVFWRRENRIKTKTLTETCCLTLKKITYMSR
jgi:hypothetical protein